VSIRLLALTAAIAVALTACHNADTSATAPAANATAPSANEADAFIAGVNRQMRDFYVESVAADWIGSTYINQDSEIVSAKASERSLTRLKQNIDNAARFAGVAGLSKATARALDLLKLQTAMPAPKDPAKLAELAQIATRLNAAYGAGQYCKDPNDSASCRDLVQLSETLATNRDWDAQWEAWQGWHSVGRGMRKDYVRFAELVNEGAREIGYGNAGEMWRAGYDMAPAAFRDETDRLWKQVEPLYTDLQCYARGKLAARYGDKMRGDGTIPAHITGNMWAQDWSALYSMLEPYPGVASLDVDGALRAQGERAAAEARSKLGAKASAATIADAEHAAHLAVAQQLTRRAEDFYVSLGMPKLPESFWTHAQFIQPRDRSVVCHASAWDMNLAGDVRIKMCINANEEDFRTIYHELGHVYYYLAYNGLEPLFQSGAHDGFHEAIGDTVQLSLTPGYLHSIGLVGATATSEQAVINAQMKLALEKVVFLPFGKLIDEWRWGVFDGSIAPDRYNAAWWELRRKYQGVAPSSTRDESDFDPGAKYHVPGNTPYMRYFLAHILQFQFQKSLCEAAGHQGPLHECSIYGNAEAGQRFWAMLSKGQSQPWQATMKELTGGEQMDASAIIDYFAPLHAWLKQQNQGHSCGW
jgi:peptidyl-dipeptidase A